MQLYLEEERHARERKRILRGIEAYGDDSYMRPMTSSIICPASYLQPDVEIPELGSGYPHSDTNASATFGQVLPAAPIINVGSNICSSMPHVCSAPKLPQTTMNPSFFPGPYQVRHSQPNLALFPGNDHSFLPTHVQRPCGGPVPTEPWHDITGNRQLQPDPTFQQNYYGFVNQDTAILVQPAWSEWSTSAPPGMCHIM